MKLRVLAVAGALAMGVSALAPRAARADDRDHRGRDDRGGRVRVVHSYRSDHGRPSYAYRSSRYDRPYTYDHHRYRYYGARPYAYGYSYDPYDYDYYDPYVYGRPVVVAPAYTYRAYRPLIGVRVGVPHVSLWLGW